MEYNDLTGHVVDAAVKLHMRLGPGLLENVYERLLALQLERRGIRVQRQAAIPFEFDGVQFENGLRVDLLVEGMLIVEVKAVEKLAPVHWRQILTYLRILDLPVGLLINFGEPTLKRGIHRVRNGYIHKAEFPAPQTTEPETW